MQRLQHRDFTQVGNQLERLSTAQHETSGVAVVNKVYLFLKVIEHVCVYKKKKDVTKKLCVFLFSEK